MELFAFNRIQAAHLLPLLIFMLSSPSIVFRPHSHSPPPILANAYITSRNLPTPHHLTHTYKICASPGINVPFSIAYPCALATSEYGTRY